MKSLLIGFIFTTFSFICFASENKVCGDCSFTGTVTDAVTKKPIADVVIIAKGISINGEQKVVTDELGQYKILSLPTGSYTLRFEKDNYRPIEKRNLVVKKTSSKLNVELISEDDVDEDHHTWILRSDFM